MKPDKSNTPAPIMQAKQVVAEQQHNGLNSHLSAIEEAELKEEALWPTIRGSRTSHRSRRRIKASRPTTGACPGECPGGGAFGGRATLPGLP